MDKQSLSLLPLRQLRQIARNHQIRLPAGMHKQEIVTLMAEALTDADIEVAQPLSPQPIGGVNPAVPELIASGGCGSLAHFAEMFVQTGCDAALAASLFHFGELTVPQVKEYLRGQNIPAR